MQRRVANNHVYAVIGYFDELFNNRLTIDYLVLIDRDSASSLCVHNLSQHGEMVLLVASEVEYMGEWLLEVVLMRAAHGFVPL